MSMICNHFEIFFFGKQHFRLPSFQNEKKKTIVFFLKSLARLQVIFPFILHEFVPRLSWQPPFILILADRKTTTTKLPSHVPVWKSVARVEKYCWFWLNWKQMNKIVRFHFNSIGYESWENFRANFRLSILLNSHPTLVWEHFHTTLLNSYVQFCSCLAETWQLRILTYKPSCIKSNCSPLITDSSEKQFKSPLPHKRWKRQKSS